MRAILKVPATHVNCAAVSDVTKHFASEKFLWSQNPSLPVRVFIVTWQCLEVCVVILLDFVVVVDGDVFYLVLT